MATLAFSPVTDRSQTAHETVSSDDKPEDVLPQEASSLRASVEVTPETTGEAAPSVSPVTEASLASEPVAVVTETPSVPSTDAMAPSVVPFVAAHHERSRWSGLSSIRSGLHSTMRYFAQQRVALLEWLWLRRAASLEKTLSHHKHAWELAQAARGCIESAQVLAVHHHERFPREQLLRDAFCRLVLAAELVHTPTASVQDGIPDWHAAWERLERIVSLSVSWPDFVIEARDGVSASEGDHEDPSHVLLETVRWLHTRLGLQAPGSIVRRRAMRVGMTGFLTVFLLFVGVRSIMRPGNLAEGKAARSSSLWPGSPGPEAVVNGVLESTWGTSTTREESAFVEVNLGRRHDIGSIEIYGRGDAWFEPGRLALEVSTDGIEFTPIAFREEAFYDVHPWVVSRTVRGVTAVRVRSVGVGLVSLDEIIVRGL